MVNEVGLCCISVARRNPRLYQAYFVLIRSDCDFFYRELNDVGTIADCAPRVLRIIKVDRVAAVSQ